MGKLILVPTPIGNLGDITFRALDTLKTVDAILAEDTRKTGILLRHYDVKNKLIPYHQHNEHNRVDSIAEDLLGGMTLALVTDAGTPGISDPGFLLVRACVRLGIEIECLPGAVAFVPALVNSGIPCERFCFEGFLPHKKGRKKRIGELTGETRTMVFYESPYRIVKLLEECAEAFGTERQASVSRELTKIYEETVRGNLAELILHFKSKPVKGEIVLVVSGKESP
ncbi:MAG: 16S rRNA (cytidine(1402)-2'-O)-methyltransferase [Bacteroidales bacterium]